MLLSVDSETYPILPGLLAPPPVCWSFAHDTAGPADLLDKAEGAARVVTYLSAGGNILGHNIAYDLAVLCAYDAAALPVVFTAYAEGRVYDTKVRAELLDIAAGRIQKHGKTLVLVNGKWTVADYSLAGQELRYFGRDRSAEKNDPNSWRLRYSELDAIPLAWWPQAAVDYAKADALGTLQVYHAQGGAIANEQAQCRAAWALHLMSVWGMRTNAATVNDLEARLLEAKRLGFNRLRRAGFYKYRRARGPRKGKDGKQIPAEIPVAYEDTKRGPRGVVWQKDTEAITKAVLRFCRKAGKEPALTDTGKVQADKDALYGSGSRVLKLLADTGGLDKILNTYVPFLKNGAVVPINSNFKVLVNTGRTACSNPNWQNMPSGRRVGGARECVVPRDGFVLAACDYSIFELRALAELHVQLFGHSKMAEALRAGKDLHLIVAAQLMNIAYDDAVTRFAAGDPAVKKHRDLAKALNFGLPGGLGADSFITYARRNYNVRVQPGEFQRLKKLWLRNWPEMVPYLAEFIPSVVGDGNARITQFWSKRQRGGVGFCDGCNTFFQGLAADAGKEALFHVSWECYVDKGTDLYGSRPVAWIHDEILAEVPAHKAHEAVLRLQSVMSTRAGEVIKSVPIETEATLMTVWSKKAKRVYENGRLVPWSPAA